MHAFTDVHFHVCAYPPVLFSTYGGQTNLVVVVVVDVLVVLVDVVVTVVGWSPSLHSLLSK